MINYRPMWLNEFFNWFSGDCSQLYTTRIISLGFLIYLIQRSGNSVVTTGEDALWKDVSEMELEFH